MKKIRILLIAFFMVLISMFFSNTYASQTRNLKAQLTRPFTNSTYKLRAGSDGVDKVYTVVKIYDENDVDDKQSLLYSKPIYCLRGGVGFGAADVSLNTVQYLESGEMHTDSANVIAKFKEYYNVDLNRTINVNGADVNVYNAILWILDESYLPVDKKNSEGKVVYDEEKYKEELLNKIGIPSNKQENITKDDLEVIQQLAIWYFANYDEQENGDLQSVSTNYRNTEEKLVVAEKLSIDDRSITSIDFDRNENLNKIYQYFIDHAVLNASIYGTENERVKVIEKNEFNHELNLEINSEKNGEYEVYKIGPFEIKEEDLNKRTGEATVGIENLVLCDADGNIVDKKKLIKEIDQITGEVILNPNNSVEVYSVIDPSTNKEVNALKKGMQYNIVFYKDFEKGSNNDLFTEDEKYDMSEVTLKISSSYSQATAKFLINTKADQPLVEIDKEILSDGDEITTKVKEFDLSLRKFIVSINNKEVESREPKIDTSKLNTVNERGVKTTTATYTHPKNALRVEVGDKVVYTIRVYNEGELDGTAISVTDYLPAGLKFIPTSESAKNAEYKWSNPSGDGKTIVTDYLKDTTIKAFDKNKVTEESGWQKATTGEGGLYYADLQIECEVVANITGDNQSLRNIAAITEDSGEDRDSNPGDPGRENYNPPADNSTYKEDDDDYENLILPGKEFDLSLRKYIVSAEDPNGGSTSVDGTLDSREPEIDTNPLKQGLTTAEYKHRKNPVVVENGNIVTYRFSVYNEGEIDGYVYSIIDYLPAGLEFDAKLNPNYIEYKEKYEASELEGKEYIYKIEGNKITITAVNSKYLFDKLSAYAGGDTLDSDSLDIKLKVTAKVTNEDQVLTNVATMTYGPANAKVADRDSAAERITVPTQQELLEKLPGYKGHNDNKVDLQDDNYHYKGQEDDDDFEKVILKGETFDLALRKYIVSIDNEAVESREPRIDTNPLKQRLTTAEYKHRKNPVVVENGNVVTYRFSVYNEGEIDGYVYSIIDYLPEGLEFDAKLNPNYIEYKEKYEASELEGKEYIYKIEENKIIITAVNSEYLFDKLSAFDGGDTLDSDSLDIKLKVTAKVTNEDQVLTNVATMTYGPANANVTDRDSSAEKITVPTETELLEKLPGYKGHNDNKDDLQDSNYHYKGQEDDDDFEKIVIKGKPFDLALRKYISSIKRNGKEVEFEDRTPKIDTTTLINGTFNRNGKKEYTATYEHSKEPLVVKNGDIITYTLRIYNEGERDGYAAEITDYIPEGLALILNYNTNFDNSWKLPKDLQESQIINLVGENGLYKTEKDVKNLKIEDFKEVESLKDVVLVTGKVEITSTELNDQLIKAFDKTKTLEESGWQKAEKGESGLYYKDIQVSCLVVAENTCKDVLTNVAEISEDKDQDGKSVTDRDSIPDNVIEKNEDDDDYEPVVLKYFDLALRKFITGVETNGKKQDITTRIPVPKMGENGIIKYEHTKEPVLVASNDTVIYTIRVYNEGTIAGYAEEITDDIPQGLLYLPEHDTNKNYGWVMIDKDGNKTEKVEEAVKIKTNYLSEEKNKEENLINPFDSSKEISIEEPLNPDYKDVKVAFKVTEPNTSDRIITNSAQISEDSDDDEDSVPGEWNEGEDDQDKEHIYVKYFDLSLLKWVTKTIVTVDGTTTTTDTGFEPNTGKTETTGIRDNEEAEPIAKVEIDRKKLDKTTVKFVYKIRVTNEGEIAGYATEITDYIPGGLEFLPEDNIAYGWTKEGEDKVTTRALETVLLQPGESAELEIVFTWINDANNLGLKSNVAEITEDYNENDSKDIDSTPDNKEEPYEKEQEDDDDFALVILSIKTGKGLSYTLFITFLLTLFASGLYLIKRYVLTY